MARELVVDPIEGTNLNRARCVSCDWVAPTAYVDAEHAKTEAMFLHWECSPNTEGVEA